MHLNFVLASHTNRSSNNCLMLKCTNHKKQEKSKTPTTVLHVRKTPQVVCFSSVSLTVITAQRCVHTAAYSTARKKNVLLRVKNELAVC